MRGSRHFPSVLGAGLLVAWAARPVAASVDAPGPWHVNLNLGAGGAGGDFANTVEKPVAFDVNLSKGSRAWRFGAGLEYSSMAMKPPYAAENDWSRMSTYALASRVFNHEGRVRPYLQARVGLARVHPRSLVFLVIPREDYEAGENPTHAANGFGLSLVPGAEIGLVPTLSLDLSAAFTAYSTSDLDLSAIGQPPAGAGNEWHLRGGLTWRPRRGTRGYRGGGVEEEGTDADDGPVQLELPLAPGIAPDGAAALRRAA